MTEVRINREYGPVERPEVEKVVLWILRMEIDAARFAVRSASDPYQFSDKHVADLLVSRGYHNEAWHVLAHAMLEEARTARRMAERLRGKE